MKNQGNNENVTTSTGGGNPNSTNTEKKETKKIDTAAYLMSLSGLVPIGAIS